MRKKTFIAVLLTVVLAATTLALVGCGNKKVAKVVLVDFPATQTVEAQKLGDTYELRRTVKDKEGNAYDLNAVVKTASGGNVSVVGAKFDLTDLGGYVVTYTATVSEKDVRTSVVTVPVYDDDDPVIVIAKPENGLVDHEYTLPTITFTDASEIAEKSVKVFNVDGDTLREIALTEHEGRYTFTPEAIGYYRISAYAKDAANNESTRTADFTVDTLLAGEAFNPESLTARNQLRSTSDPDTEYTFVSAEDNDDEIYGGAYWLVKPNQSGWKNTHLTPRLPISEYAEYDVITMWVYAESAKPSAGIGSFVILGDVELNQGTGNGGTMKSNEWTLVEIPIAKFIEKVESQMLFAVSYADDIIYGVRLGEVMAKKRTDYAVTNFSAATLADGGAVAFTVTGSSEYKVTVTVAGGGNPLDGLTHNGDNYSMTVAQAGDYTITVAPVNSIDYGTLTFDFTVYDSLVIAVDGDYLAVVPTNKEIDLLSASVYSGTTVMEEMPVSKALYKKNGANWAEVTSGIAGDKFTPAEAGEYKVVYSASGVDSVEKTFTVAATGEVFDPSAAYSGEQIAATGAAFNGTVKTVVSADENDDAVYDGAYVQYTVPGTGWSNIGITPTFAREQYAEFDYVTAWIYLGQKEGAAEGTAMLVTGGVKPYRRYVKTGAWTQLTFIKLHDGITHTYADNVFCENVKFGNDTAATFNFGAFFSVSWSADTEYVRIGEIKAGKFVAENKTTETVFDPTAENIAANFKGQGTFNTEGVVNPDTDGAYKGACVGWKPGTGWQNLYLTPTTGNWESLAGYQQIKVWVYVQTGAKKDFELIMLGDTSAGQKITTDTWVELTLDIGLYIEYIKRKPNASTSSGNPYFMSQKAWAGATVYVGTMTAIDYV